MFVKLPLGDSLETISCHKTLVNQRSVSQLHLLHKKERQRERQKKGGKEGGVGGNRYGRGSRERTREDGIRQQTMKKKMRKINKRCVIMSKNFWNSEHLRTTEK